MTNTTTPASLLLQSGASTNPPQFINPVTEFGADNTGATDTKAELQAARNESRDTGRGIILPAGSYLTDGKTYVHENNRIFIHDGFSGINTYPYWAQTSQIVKLISETNQLAGTDDGKVPLAIDIQQYGNHHTDALRINTTNYGAGDGGNTGIYCRGITGPDAGWLAAIHAESRHGGGSMFALNLENQSYTSVASGVMYGIHCKVGTKNGWGRPHPTTGALPAAHHDPKGVVITGSRGQIYGDKYPSLPYPNEVNGDGNREIYDEMAWKTALEIQSGATRSDGDAIDIQPMIGLNPEGNPNTIQRGIRIQSTNSVAALTVPYNEKIGFDDNANVYARSPLNSTSLSFGFNNTDRISFSLNSSPSIQINNKRVVSVRQPSVVSLADTTLGSVTNTVVNVSGTGDDSSINDNFAALVAKIEELTARLRSHGLIEQ